MSDARSLPRAVDAVVVGAGLAGASAARSLAGRGLSVLLLEADRAPGMHASGRNAAILRRVVDEPVTAALARASGARMADPPGDLGVEHPLLVAHGVLLVARVGEAAAGLRRAAALARDGGLAVEDLDPEGVVARAPLLRGAPPAVGAWHAADGVVDVVALMDGMIRSARRRGAILAPGLPLAGVRRDGRRVAAVETPRGTVATRWLVDAAGAHADPVAALAGLPPLGLVPYRRHLFHLGPSALLPHGAPAIWDVESGIYLRPEGMGVLASPCDEVPHPPGDEEPRVVPSVRNDLVEKMEASFPAFGRLVVRRAWAGLRTLSPDGRFVIGPDPRLAGFAWLAALGGHGVTTALAVGDALADLLLDGRTALGDGDALRPDRLFR